MGTWTQAEMDEYVHDNPDAGFDSPLPWLEDVECLEQSDDCEGKVEMHFVGNATRAFPRCEFHLNKRWEREEDIIALEAWGRNVDYLDAGERWDIDE